MAKWTNKQIGTSSRNCQFYIKAVRLDPLFRVSYIVGAVIGFPSERGGAHLEIFSTVYSLFLKFDLARNERNQRAKTRRGDSTLGSILFQRDTTFSCEVNLSVSLATLVASRKKHVKGLTRWL